MKNPFFAVPLAALSLLGSLAFAGGVQCKQCPAESENCFPLAGCKEVSAGPVDVRFDVRFGDGARSKLQSHDPPEQTDGAACCSWSGETPIPDCMPGC